MVNTFFVFTGSALLFKSLLSFLSSSSSRLVDHHGCKGERKIKMKLMKRKEARLVCFSKRRSGLFKKAMELSILCGAKVGAVAFSFSGKPMVFDAPTLDSLLDPQRQICSKLPPLQEVANDWESAFCEAMAGKVSPFWWERVDVQSMGMEELLVYQNALVAYKEKLFFTQIDRSNEAFV